MLAVPFALAIGAGAQAQTTTDTTSYTWLVNAANDAVDKARRKAARDDAARKKAKAAGGEPEEAAEVVDPAETAQPDLDAMDDHPDAERH